MSSSAEMPDVIGGISNALGLNKLWQSDEQADSEKRKSDQAHQPSEDEVDRGRKKDNKDVAPVSIKDQQPNGIDHDDDVHGVPRTEPPRKKKGYEWPMPMSANNKAKTKYDDASTQDADKEPPTDDDQQEQDGKASFAESFIPFFQKSTISSSPLPTSAMSAPLHRENPFEQPRPQTAPDEDDIDGQVPLRPKTQRQSTVPAKSDDRPGSKGSEAKHARARSRWATAAQGLRIPLRRKKTTQSITKARGPTVINTLAAGVPAANLIASHMLPDEHSHHRIPVIVDLLKVTP